MQLLLRNAIRAIHPQFPDISLVHQPGQVLGMHTLRLMQGSVPNQVATAQGDRAKEYRQAIFPSPFPVIAEAAIKSLVAQLQVSLGGYGTTRCFQRVATVVT